MLSRSLLFPAVHNLTFYWPHLSKFFCLSLSHSFFYSYRLITVNFLLSTTSFSLLFLLFPMSFLTPFHSLSSCLHAFLSSPLPFPLPCLSFFFPYFFPSILFIVYYLYSFISFIYFCCNFLLSIS